MSQITARNGVVPSTPDPEAVASLTQIITSLSTSDTATIRTAEASLRTATSSPAVVLPLAAIACENPGVATRHLAAVLLRRAIQTHWSSLPPGAQAALQAGLLARLPAEDAPGPRRGLAAAAAAVCRGRSGLWTELTQTAVAMTRAESPFVRVGGFKVFDAVADAVPGSLAPHAPTVCLLIAQGLRDGVPDVRHAALGAYATCTMAVALYSSGDEPWKAVGELVPGVADVARAAAAAYLGAGPDADDDEVSRVLCQVFDVLSTLSESPGGVVMKPHFLDLFRFALEIVVPPQMPLAARQGAVEYVCSALSNKPKTLKKAGLVEAALFEAFRMALMHRRDRDGGEGDTDGYDDADVDDDEDAEVDGFDLALRMVYTAASRGDLALQVFGEVMRMVPTLMSGDVAPFNLTRPPSSPHHGTTVAFRVIGAIADGCSGEVSAHAKELLTRLAAGAVDGATPARTRGYAVESMACVIAALDLSEVSDVDQEQCARVCFQAVLHGMRDPSMFVKRGSCIALEPTLDMFSDDSQPMSERVRDILSALECLGPSAAIEAVSVAAIVAEHIGDDFVSSDAYRSVIGGLTDLMGRTEAKDISARAAATQSAGLVVSSCRDWPTAERLASLALSSFDIDDAGLAEATFVFFAKLADTYGGKVAVAYGDRVLARILTSCNREDVVFSPEQDDASGLFAAGVDDDDDADEGAGSYGVRTAYLDEKAMATFAIGSIATAVATKEFYELASASSSEAASNARSILSQLTAVGSCLDLMVTYFHEDIRAAGVRSDVAYAIAADRARLISPQLAFGPEETTLRTIERLVSLLNDDDDVFVVTRGLHSLASFCSGSSLSSLVQYKGGLLDAIISLIEGGAVCQSAQDDDSDDEDGGLAAGNTDDVGGEHGDERGTLIDGICEALGAFARALRGHFVSDWMRLQPKILQFLVKATSLPRNTSIVVGMFADVYLFMGWDRCPFSDDVPQHGSTPWIAWQTTIDELAGQLIPHVLVAASGTGKGGTSRNLRRNAVFLLGVLFGASSPTASGVWSKSASALQLFEAIVNQGKKVDGALVDNAVGAASRIITAKGLPSGVIASHRNALHLVLTAVPLEDDPAENNSVARALVSIAAGGDFGAVEMMADAAVVCLVSAVLSSIEEDENAAIGICSAEADLNDRMTRLDASERLLMVQLLKEVLGKCGDAPFRHLVLEGGQQGILENLLSA